MNAVKLNNHWHQDYFTPDNKTFEFPNGNTPRKYRFTEIHISGYCSRCKQRIIASYKLNAVTMPMSFKEGENQEKAMIEKLNKKFKENE